MSGPVNCPLTLEEVVEKRTFGKSIEIRASRGITQSAAMQFGLTELMHPDFFTTSVSRCPNGEEYMFGPRDLIILLVANIDEAATHSVGRVGHTIGIAPVSVDFIHITLHRSGASTP